jgi:hypothetical protein
MGSILSTIFSFTNRFNALKFSKNIVQKEEEFNSSIESVVVAVVQESSDIECVKSNFSLEPRQELASHSIIPTAEPNSFQYKLPIAKRKSRQELRVYCPLADNYSCLQVHEFVWKYGGKQVFLAGTFNDWNPSEIELIPADSSLEYHHVQVELDPTRTWEFKFIVDGVWRCNLDIESVTDMNGNTNNVIYPE